MTVSADDVEAVKTIVGRIKALYRGWGASATPEQMRRDWDNLFPDPVGVQISAVNAGGVPAEWLTVDDTDAGRVLLLLHGGGYLIGSPRSHRPLAAALARAAQLRVLSIDYHLAPKHQFPTQIDDALAAYRWLLEQGTVPRQIFLVGDSAGGNLALALLLALKADSQSLPASVALLSPWTDMTASSESYEARRLEDPLHQRAMILSMADQYLGGADPHDPRASPLFADLSGLPPMLIQVGDRETLLDDARQFAQRATTHGVDATLEVYPEMIHVFQLFPDELAAARKAITAIAAFATATLG